MKGITKDHQSITKDYKSLFNSMKDQRKKIFALHFSLFRNSPEFISSLKLGFHMALTRS